MVLPPRPVTGRVSRKRGGFVPATCTVPTDTMLVIIAPQTCNRSTRHHTCISLTIQSTDHRKRPAQLPRLVTACPKKNLQQENFRLGALGGLSAARGRHSERARPANLQREQDVGAAGFAAGAVESAVAAVRRVALVLVHAHHV